MSTETSTLRDGSTVAVGPLGRGDEAQLLALLHSVPERDLLFVRVDISDEAVIRNWTESVGDRETVGAVARKGAEVVGFAILQRPRVAWMHHVGSMLVVTAPGLRGVGLGTILLRRAVLLAHEAGIEKIVARMVVEDRDTVRVFEKLGFRQEGLLLDHAKSADGTLHDIAYMSLAVRKHRDAIEAGGNAVDLTRRPAGRGA
jgi:RimJ/RimL family protein N-acetyltransferase